MDAGSDFYGDFFEELGGFRRFYSGSRFFPRDSDTTGASRSLKDSVPYSLKGSSKMQLIDVGKDMCIFYSRWIILRSISTDASVLSIVMNEEFGRDEVTRKAEMMVQLIRLCSSLDMCDLDLLPENAYSCAVNAGGPSFSIFRGIHVLDSLLSPLIAFLRNCGNATVHLTRAFLAHLKLEIIRLTGRSIGERFSLDPNGGIPHLSNEEQREARASPSLKFLLWTTRLIASSWSRDYPYVDNDDALIQTCRAWYFGLRSSSTAFKSLSARVLSVLTQKVCCVQPGLIPDAFSVVDYSRIHRYTLSMLFEERKIAPICSEYFISLAELTLSLSAMGSATSMQAAKPDSHEGVVEASMRNRLYSDDSLDFWSGRITQNPAAAFVDVIDTINDPPPLVPGCIVCRSSLISNCFVEGRNVDSLLVSADAIVELGRVVDFPMMEETISDSARLVRWDSGSTEIVRWNVAGGEFDVRHVEVDEQGYICRIFPLPLSSLDKEKIRVLKSMHTYGVILRANPDAFSGDEAESTGVMEWPEMGSCIHVSIRRIGSSAFSIIEKCIVSGLHCSCRWLSRFASRMWKPGTTYYVSVDKESCDTHDVSMFGTYSLTWNVGSHAVEISGDISLQQSRLFWFDTRLKSPALSISKDGFVVTNLKGGKAVCFGHVGFSSGVHYWEFKIEQADSGFAFLGVAERPSDFEPSNLNKWFGCGMVSNRTAFNLLHKNSGSIVYGESFHTGDVVGVQLDMNRGRLAFFLDGMKYGEHLLIAMGDAFDNLHGSDRGRTLTLYPIVGLQRIQDRVALTSKWISIPGTSCKDDFSCIQRTWSSISDCYSSAMFARPSNNGWLYSQACGDFISWKKGKTINVKSRANCISTCIRLDLSLTASAESSIRLGLERALYPGDKIRITKSCGRLLENQEEAIILGTYRKRLWYRLTGDNVSEGSSLAWFLAPYDSEGLFLLQRGGLVPDRLSSLELPRIPKFRGGTFKVTCKDGAIMRNGLEIDTADVICTIEYQMVVFAIEKRLNSSNIVRYRVFYNGALGWISAFMRGGSEDIMLEPIDLCKDNVVALTEEVRTFLHLQGLADKFEWIEAENVVAAVQSWRSSVVNIGCGQLLQDDDERTYLSVDDFEALAHCSLGTRWTLEKDMLLSELISKSATMNDGLPASVSFLSLEKAVELLETEGQVFDCGIDSILARASLLITFNHYLFWALPFLSLSDPIEKLRTDGNSFSEFDERVKSFESLSSIGRPPCAHDTDDVLYRNTGAQRLLSLRRLVFSQTKRVFLEAVLHATTTYTPPHVDEYEDPREIKLVKVNRVKATPSLLASIPNHFCRWRQTVMGQLHGDLRSWGNSNFRRSYVCKGHGGQKRCFKVQFIGEGVHDYGGPYRAVFEQIVDELQCDSILVGRNLAERCLLPLFIPSPNRAAGVGSNQDTFLINPSISSMYSVSLMYFLGKLLGTAVRHNLTLALDVSNTFWRALVRLPLTRLHLEQVDALCAKSIAEIERTGVTIEEDIKAGVVYPEDFIPEEWNDLRFSTCLSDGSWVPLIPDGERVPVTLRNWRRYVLLVEMARLTENVFLLRVLLDGIGCVLPREILPLFTANEARLLFTGESKLDIEVLKANTEYENVSPDSELVGYFWDVLHDLGDDERTQFLRFVWARSRMPASAQEFRVKFKLLGELRENPDEYLPHAQTCFFSLTLPHYSSKDILKSKLLYAIENSPNMDADVRLHSAEGWDP